LGPFSRERWAPRVEVTEKVPRCGDGRKLFGVVISEAVHASEVFGGEREPQKRFAEALRCWLKCFSRP
jgi:hypothetical protein